MATIPCCLADDCLNEKAATEKTSDNHNQPSEAETECGLCSPFYSCPTCSGFTFSNAAPKLVVVLLMDIKGYTAYQQHFIPTFTPSIWQPPKLA